MEFTECQIWALYDNTSQGQVGSVAAVQQSCAHPSLYCESWCPHVCWGLLVIPWLIPWWYLDWYLDCWLLQIVGIALLTGLWWVVCPCWLHFILFTIAFPSLRVVAVFTSVDSYVMALLSMCSALWCRMLGIYTHVYAHIDHIVLKLGFPKMQAFVDPQHHQG